MNEEDLLDPSVSFDQLLKCAADLRMLHESDKEKSEEIRRAHEQLLHYANSLNRTIRELRDSRAALELSVEERTAELIRVNEALKREVSERKRMQEWLIDSERRYRVLVEGVPDVMFVLDRQGRFTYLNTQAEKFLGCSISNLLETNLADHVVPEDRAKVSALLEIPLDGVWDEEVALLDAQGNRKWSRIRCKAVKLKPEDPLRFEGVMRDTTLRKRLEQDLKASREELLEKIRIIDDLYAHIVEAGKAKAIADYTAEVAHELRQPLAIIGGFARRMSKRAESCESGDATVRVESIRIIMKEIERLERILGRLVDFTKRGEIVLESVDPNRIIENIVRVYREMPARKNLRIEANLCWEIGEIYLDPLRFDQAVRNLLSDAIEASPDDETIRIETAVSVPGGKAHQAGELDSESYFQIKISNHGTVLPQEELRKIFNPFSTTKNYGTGIGLTLAKRIVEDHGGSVSVHSAEGGTMFTVWLPIRFPQRPSLGAGWET